jgi:hypothetical protein
MESWLQNLSESIFGKREPEEEKGPKPESIFKKSLSVRVKPGVRDDDFNVDFEGWQGRLTDDAEDGYVNVAWDSIALRALPPEMIASCEIDGEDWETYGFEEGDVEPAPERDTPADVEAVAVELRKAHAWDSFGDEVEIAREVLAGLDPDDEPALFEAWEKYLRAHLAFPFAAKIEEPSDQGPFRAREKVQVYGIAGVTEDDGIVVDVTNEKGLSGNFPLDALEVVGADLATREIVRNYRVWLENW